MRTSMRLLGMALAAAIVTGSGVRGEDEKAALSGDLKALQGTWVSSPDDSHESRWVFEGKTLKSTTGDRDYVCEVTLDPKATPHPAIDLLVTDGPDDSTGKTSHGIYKLEGDSLKICVTIPGDGSRPTEFKTVEDEAYLFDLKREAKGER
jgi:uncharacterized protein (TIGR03067 family)